VLRPALAAVFGKIGGKDRVAATALEAPNQVRDLCVGITVAGDPRFGMSAEAVVAFIQKRRPCRRIAWG